ncbi:MAG TPA: hypothetical protein VHX38_22485 [Pseudonocardiaceae bacterium]|nr:hypothetical protein [Pseudonocardiaceae bacterium]
MIELPRLEWTDEQRAERARATRAGILAHSTPQERRQSARAAALARWTHDDPVACGRRAQDVYLERLGEQLARQYDPDGKWSAEERRKRAIRLRASRLSRAGSTKSKKQRKKKNQKGSSQSDE